MHRAHAYALLQFPHRGAFQISISAIILIVLSSLATILARTMINHPLVLAAVLVTASTTQ